MTDVTPTNQTELRDRIADVLAAADGWKWAEGFKEHSPTWQGYLKRADAVLAVLPPPADRAAVLREAATIVRSMDSDYALQEAAEHLDGLANEDDEEREAQAHLDALAPIADGAPLPDLDGPALYDKLVGMFGGPLPWPPPDSRPDLVTLRERIAEDLYAHDHPGWCLPMVESDAEPVYRARAVAVLDGLRQLVAAVQHPWPATRAESHEWAARQVREAARGLFFEAGARVLAALDDDLRRMADEAQQQPDTETLAALFEGFGRLLATDDDPAVVINPAQARHLAEQLTDWADQADGGEPR